MKLNRIIVSVLFFVALTASSLFAKKTKTDDSKLKVVTTIFPEYDWAKEIIGENADNVELTLLMNNGVDLHSYSPSVKDIAKISESDIFVYVGGESDEWVDGVLKNATNKNMKVINLLDVLGEKVKSEEIVEGMEHEHEHNEHSHSHSSEIHEHDIKDRTLSEFNGEWQSLYPVLTSGKLEEYVEHQAKEKGKSEKDMQKEIEAKWNCGVKLVKVGGDKITLTYDNGKSVTGKYSYAGYAVKKNDEGKITNVRYKFETSDKNAPKYVMFNDHGYAPSDDVAHFHFYFGNNSFEEFMNSKVNSYFVASKLSAHECEDLLLGRNHNEHHHHDEDEKDEHVWLSLRNASELCAAIADALCEKDSANASVYKKNLASYKAKLSRLDGEYSDVVKSSRAKTLLFGDRFPFRYLVDDYNLKYFAAFTGCSAESEASFNTIVFLAGKLDELGLKSVCQIENGNGKIAKTVIANSKTKNATILTFDSLQSTTAKQIKKGATYLGTMEKNLSVLKEALK
ncbi:MAG: zinc ABC transporter substrate-binding protein [Treponema sp.]|nr:zinc ABC transporter substrate-binding protein [Treponema sp.]